MLCAVFAVLSLFASWPMRGPTAFVPENFDRLPPPSPFVLQMHGREYPIDNCDPGIAIWVPDMERYVIRRFEVGSSCELPQPLSELPGAFLRQPGLPDTKGQNPGR